MFYFEEVYGSKVLRSDLLKGVNHCFTTRGTDIAKFNKKIVSPQQTHSDFIQIVDERLEYPNTDGLILAQKDVMIALRFADCTPLIFYDSKQNIGAVTHAGWRGTAQKIGPKTIEKMNIEYCTNPADVIAVIGPAIGVCCYEVSSDVKMKLLGTVKNITSLVKDKNVDLKQINARQLEEIGVLKIDICPYCTSCNNDLFYSYRKENGTQERHYAMLMLQ